MLSHMMSQHYEWQKPNSSTSCPAVLIVLWLTAVNSVKQLNISASVPAFFRELILDHLGSWIRSHIVVNINYANSQEGRASKPASNCSCYQWRNRQIRPRPKKLGQLAWIFNSCRWRLSKKKALASSVSSACESRARKSALSSTDGENRRKVRSENAYLIFSSFYYELNFRQTLDMSCMPSSQHLKAASYWMKISDLFFWTIPLLPSCWCLPLLGSKKVPFLK